MLLTKTVGVAPGTTTLQLGEVYPNVAAKSINWIPARPTMADPPHWFMPDRSAPMFDHTPAYPTGFRGLGQQRVYYDLYQRDFWRMDNNGNVSGALGLRGPDNIRWDLIGVVGGGAFVIALATSMLASMIK